MVEFSDSLLYKMRFLAGGLLIVFGLLLLPVFVSMIFPNSKVQAADPNSFNSNMEDSPNIITSGMFSAADGLGQASNSAAHTVNDTISTTTNSIATASVASGKFVVHSVGSSTVFVAHGIGGSFGFMAHTTGHVFGFFANPPAVGNIIRPADSTKVEVISNGPPTLPSHPAVAVQQIVTPAPQSQPDSSAAWPIHGIITTEFGASDWPYQAHHTGIDISDGKYSGITPIHPFKPGRVVEVIHSNVSLGNHVVVDNGGGITSVYGHMYSINVQVGQQVDKNTVLGLEGSTGASTGTHVHFEIRVNGQLVNPHNYIAGQP
jgi:murein DD-endopeptidase MepM/ murein hydrolase activator NlpD